MIRSTFKALALGVLAIYGVVMGLLGGHLWFALFIVPSTTEFSRRMDLWASEKQFYMACAILGASALLWFGIGASNGHFGFGKRLVGSRGRRRSCSVGATYGAAAGAFLGTSLGLTFSLMVAAHADRREPGTSSPLAILFEVGVAGALGAAAGAVLAPLLVKPTNDADPVRDAPSWSDDTRRGHRLLVAGVLVTYGVVLAAFPAIPDGKAASAVLVACSALFCLAGVASFIRRLTVILPGGPARSYPAIAAWASAAGAICGAGIGLRLTTFGLGVARLDDAWVAVAVSAVAGAAAGLAIAKSTNKRALTNP